MNLTQHQLSLALSATQVIDLHLSLAGIKVFAKAIPSVKFLTLSTTNALQYFCVDQNHNLLFSDEETPDRVLSRPEKLSLQAALFSNIGRIEPFWLSADEYYVFETDLVAGLKQQKMLSSALANSGISDFYGIPLCQATNLQYLTYYLSRKINS